MIMAILKGITVAVTVNGQDLTEHEAEESADDQGTASDSLTRYIEATAGANFALRLGAPSPNPYGCQGVSFATYVDGVQVQIVDMIHCKTYLLEGHLRARQGNWTVQKFRFQNLLLGL